MGFIGAAFALLAIGTIIAMVVAGEYLMALRFAMATVIGVGIGGGIRSHLLYGRVVGGLLLGVILFALGLWILPSPLRLGPELFLPDYVWMVLTALLGFLVWKPEDARDLTSGGARVRGSARRLVRV